MILFHFRARDMDQPPTSPLDQPRLRPQGLRVRLVGGVMDGRTHVISNPDDVRYIVVPLPTDGGFRQLRYERVMDKQGLRYVCSED